MLAATRAAAELGALTEARTGSGSERVAPKPAGGRVRNMEAVLGSSFKLKSDTACSTSDVSLLRLSCSSAICC